MKNLLIILSLLISLPGRAQYSRLTDPAFMRHHKNASGPPPGPTDAIAWYKFNNDLTDASGTGNGLTGNNSPTFTTGENGAANGAVALNGSSQNGYKTSAVSLPSGDVSYSAWAYPTATSGGLCICCLGNYNAGSSSQWNDLYLELDPGSQGVGLFRFQSGSFTGTSANPTIATSAWTYIAAIFHSSSGGVDIYTNGVLCFSQTIATGFPSGVNAISVGAFINDSGSGHFQNWFQGNIDDVRIFARAITSTEVTTLYNAQAAYFKQREDFYLAFGN